MNFFYNHLVHGFVGLAAMASVGLGGSVIAQQAQAHANVQAKVHIDSKVDTDKKADKREHKEAKHSSVVSKHIDVIIGANSRVLVHGATVTAVSSTSVSAKSSIGASVINWAVNTDSAKIVVKGDGIATLGSIVIGDTVNFAGKLSSTSAFTVNASVLQDKTR
ncbi:MAG: hypothetical protein Q7S26_03920 [bacterium]|nr:hypothetical protein [bacterium]